MPDNSNSKMDVLMPSLIRPASMLHFVVITQDQILSQCLMRYIEFFHQPEFTFALPMVFQKIVYHISIKTPMTGQFSHRKQLSQQFLHQPSLQLEKRMTIRTSISFMLCGNHRKKIEILQFKLGKTKRFSETYFLICTFHVH